MPKKTCLNPLGVLSDKLFMFDQRGSVFYIADNGKCRRKRSYFLALQWCDPLTYIIITPLESYRQLRCIWIGNDIESGRRFESGEPLNRIRYLDQQLIFFFFVGNIIKVGMLSIKREWYYCRNIIHKQTSKLRC